LLNNIKQTEYIKTNGRMYSAVQLQLWDKNLLGWAANWRKRSLEGKVLLSSEANYQRHWAHERKNLSRMFHLNGTDLAYLFLAKWILQERKATHWNAQ